MTSQRSVLITGGTGALGFETAKVIGTSDDGLIIITGRDPESVEGRAETLNRDGGAKVVGLPLDLASLMTCAGLPPISRPEIFRP